MSLAYIYSLRPIVDGTFEEYYEILEDVILCVRWRDKIVYLY